MAAEWLRTVRRRRIAFLSVMALLAAALGGLGWRLLVQDEQLATQRMAEDRETAADLVAAALERRLSGIERDLDRLLATAEIAPAVPTATSALTIHVRQGVLHVSPPGRLLYYPETPNHPEPRSAIFDRSDELEFRRQDPAGVLAVLQPYAVDPDSAIAAAALVRIARNQLKSDRPADAASTYDRLAALGEVPVGGMPAALAAHLGRLALFEKEHDTAALLASARALTGDLRSGRWPVSHAVYSYLDQEAARWLPPAERHHANGLGLAEAVDWLWDKRRVRDAALTRHGRLSLALASGSVLLVWRVSADDVAAVAAGADGLESAWLPEIKRLVELRGADLALITPSGNHLVGSAATSERTAIRLASATGLPWTIQTTTAGDGRLRLRERRRLFIVGMAVLVGLIATGAWFIEQTIARELAVADLQSDFVSAVSHEFRTPLTTLCQLSELLVRNRVASEEDRRQYYELLHAESDRLRRLVEALLNFGRLESGTMQFRFDAVVVPVLVRETVADFSRTDQARGHRIEVSIGADSASVSADREMLRSVVWNLLENAVKYSPGCDTVWVDMSAPGDRVEIAVRDCGVGIPRGEQQRIFDKFVRGSAARASDVRGTGVGLAMARQVVHAHSGDITVESEPGKGSTFTVALPLLRDDPLPDGSTRAVGARGFSRAS